MYKILLTDDDVELTELLAEYLATQGLDVDIANDGQEGLDMVKKGQYDLMVLDIMMPKIDGLEVLKQLQKEKYIIPVIMLTAKGDDIDRIIGLEIGADDYLTKPCNPRELLARINAILRRNKNNKQNYKQDDIDTVNSIINIDVKTRSVKIKGEEVILTGTEFDLLNYLIINSGKTVSKEVLSLEVLDRELDPFDRSLDVHISRVRKKLELFLDKPIKTVRGKGYQMSI